LAVRGAVQQLGVALSFGPKPVDEAIARLEELTVDDTGDRAVEANVALCLGHLESMRENFDLARNHVERARIAFRDLGLTNALIDTCGRFAGLVELLAGSPDVAEQSLRDACDLLQELHDTPVLATRAAELATALYEQKRYDEALEWVRISRESAVLTISTRPLARQPVEAKLLARRGAAQEAEQLARTTVSLAERTDSPNRQAMLSSAWPKCLSWRVRRRESSAREAGTRFVRAEGKLAAARIARRRLPSRVSRPDTTKSPTRGSSSHCVSLTRTHRHRWCCHKQAGCSGTH
jgi:hypothetical protein